jgi:glycosyltransferase involved in cell wall biosynthesis
MSEHAQNVHAPSVSVLMPIYNAQKYVGQAVESVFAQTHGKVELIAIDDGSTDRSTEIVEQLLRDAPIPMHFERQQNSGPSPALHKALARATGHWICWLAADDYYPPEFVERNLAVAAGLPRDDLVLHSNAFLIEDDGEVTGTMDAIARQRPFEGHCFELIVSGEGRMLPSTMFTTRALLERAGGFDPNIRLEDTDLFLRLGRVAFFHYIRQPNFYSRYTPGSYGKKPWAWGETIIVALSKHEDILGSRLPGLLSQASENISAHCLEQGVIGPGLHWAARAVGYAPGPVAKARVVGKLASRGSWRLARSTAVRLFGRSALLRLKRALQRV